MTTLVLADVTSVDAETAKKKVVQYREAVRATRRAEDAALAQAFQAVAKGKRIISLNETIRQGGIDEYGRPRLAVCAADARRCTVFLSRDEDLVFFDESATANVWHMRVAIGSHHVLVPWRRADRAPTILGRGQTWRAMVPLVPPEHRPPRRHDKPARYDPLASCHIVWEAEWQPERAPKDPALIRHIAGDLWQLLAVWDLTELERLVITGTRA